MSILSEISQELWEGKITIEITVAAEDMTSLTLCTSCFLFVSRMSYLNIVAADSVDYLKSFAIDISSDVWFDYEGSPLKWYVIYLSL